VKSGMSELEQALEALGARAEVATMEGTMTERRKERDRARRKRRKAREAAERRREKRNRRIDELMEAWRRNRPNAMRKMGDGEGRPWRTFFWS
jgi:hypothetical protein